MLIDLIILWIHVFTAIFFVGGSFFIWLVVYPASFKITDDEKLRTKIVGRIGKEFAAFTNVSIIILILTGLYNATWYLGNDFTYDLLNTESGQILLVKGIFVVAMVLLMYGNNIYHGKRIMKMSQEGDLEGLKRLRKTSHLLSYITLALMMIITILAVALGFY
ncbi:MAG: CopD family protein [Thermoplasmataceae archaeon]